VCFGDYISAVVELGLYFVVCELGVCSDIDFYFETDSVSYYLFGIWVCVAFDELMCCDVWFFIQFESYVISQVDHYAVFLR